MSMSSSNVRLPHASAGPFWAPAPVEPRHEWHEIETLLTAPPHAARSTSRQRRGIPSFVFVAAALLLGGGLLGMSLIGSRSDCGAACHVVTATAGPSGEAPRHADMAMAAPSQAHHADTAALAPAPDTAMKEGRSAAEPVLDMTTPAVGTPDSAASDPVIPEPVPSPLPRRHHHHHHGVHP